jgi:hypothetical protein
VEDLNGDGILDIASAATDQWLDNPFGGPPHPTFANRDITGVHIYTGDGTGGFTEAARYTGTEHLVAVDYDDDGDVDLVTRHLDPQSFGVVLLNESDGDISLRVGDTLGLEDYLSHITERTTYDINGDEFPDQLETRPGYDWGNYNTPDETVYRLGRGDGSFDSPIHLAALFYGNWRQFGLGVELAVVLAVGEGDFDEDGKLTMDDFAILARNFGLEEAKREQGDANGDGKVDFKDFVAFARGFSRL